MAKGIVLLLATFVLSVSAFSQTTNSEKLHSVKELTRIAFGSCNDQNDPQPLWADMEKMNPDLFIWGGDVIYADWESSYNMASSYQKQIANSGYLSLKARTPVIGTWDDHDYAFDNADGTVANKDQSQRQFLDFLEEPATSSRRLQKGIYTSYEFGSDGHKIKIILLDNRYFKNLDQNYPILGKDQWDWLEKEFATSTADMHIVMAGLPIFSPSIPYTEEWAEHPNELNRMLGLLKKYTPKGILFLTGDKHFAAINQNYGQLEFMASGMTHVAPRATWWFLRRKYQYTYFGLNYGLVDISWEESTPKIRLTIRGTGGEDIHPKNYRWISGKWVLVK